MARTLIDYLQNPGTDGPALGQSLVSLIQDTDFVEISASFRSSLFPERGPLPTYFTGVVGTPALPTIVDCFGMLKTCNPGEALFYGARRVENLIRYSEHLSRTQDATWACLNGAGIAPVTNPLRPGKTGDMTAWKLSRGAQVNSVLRTDRALQYHHGIGGLDLLLPVPHFLGINMRQSDTNVVSTAEPRIYTPGGNVHATKVVTLDATMRTFGLTFTPTTPRQISALTWSSGTLTVTCPSHGYATGVNIRLSGSSPSTFDVSGPVLSVPNANSFTIAMATSPGTLVAAGLTQLQYFFGVAPISWASTLAGDIEIEKPYVSEMLGYDAGLVPEYVPRHRVPQRKYWYGAAVDGVQYFATAPSWSHDETSGLVTEATGADLDTCLGVATYPFTTSRIQRRQAETFGEWTKSDASIAVADMALPAPTGMQEAARLTEGTHGGRHYLQLPAGQLANADLASDLTSSLTCFMAKPTGSAGRDWAVLSFTDKAGVEQHGYFNLATGETGNRTSGFQYLNMEQLAEIGGLAYFRLHASLLNGNGSTTPLLRIGLASANGSNSYAGDGTRYLALWGVALAGGTESRPVASPYGRRGLNEGAILAGAAVTFQVSGLLRQDMLTAYSAYTPYYSFYQPGRVSWAASLYFRCEPVQSISAATSTGLGGVTLDRFGIVIRPNFSSSDLPSHFTKVALDHYNGEACKHYIFRAGDAYQVGDTVVPSDITPNNGNGRKMWTVTTGGVAGAEPAWPTVTSLPSASVTSGEVTFRVTHDNGITGSFEPYNGAHTQPPTGFMPTMRAAFFFTPASYGAFINGEEAEKQTWPQPVNPDQGYAMRSPIATMVLGGNGNDEAIDPTTFTSYAGPNMLGQMPRHTAFHRDVVVWNAAKTPAYLAALTAGV